MNIDEKIEKYLARYAFNRSVSRDIDGVAKYNTLAEIDRTRKKNLIKQAILDEIKKIDQYIIYVNDDEKYIKFNDIRKLLGGDE